jgi:hypothetical protein
MILISVIIIPVALIVGFKLPKRATVCILTGEPEEIPMDFEEVIIEDEGWEEVHEHFDIDAWHGYWMDIVDPRGTYPEGLAAFKFEQASGSGEWDY